jgi:putative endonuclease
MTTHELGQLGERMAENYLTMKGFKIVDKNIRYRKWEIDLIAHSEDKLVIVEVKTRQTREIGEPWKAVTRTKQKQIIACANNYIRKRNIALDVRFDIVSIVHNQYQTNMEHIEGAFYP